MTIKPTYIVTGDSYTPTDYHDDGLPKEYTKESDATKEALRAVERSGGEAWVWRLTHVASAEATIEAAV